jgi:hypothetical protein
MELRPLLFSSLALIFAFAAAPAGAESVQALKGQSPEQTQKDIAECQAAATQSTGYNPAAPPPVSSSGPEVGGRARGAAVGAAAGAVAGEVRGNQHDELYDRASDDAKQEYRQNQAQEAAAAGAVVGASRQRRERRDDRGEEKQQAEQANAAQAAHKQAYQGCLTGRGYSVTP